MSAKIISELFLKVSIIHAKFCAIPFNRIRDLSYTFLLHSISLQIICTTAKKVCHPLIIVCIFNNNNNNNNNKTNAVLICQSNTH